MNVCVFFSVGLMVGCFFSCLVGLMCLVLISWLARIDVIGLCRWNGHMKGFLSELGQWWMRQVDTWVIQGRFMRVDTRVLWIIHRLLMDDEWMIH